MLFKELSQKPGEYIFLLLILLLGAILFFVYGFDPHSQRRIIYFTSAAYLLWSLFHHYRRGDLELSIVLEYLLFALFAIVIITSTLLR